MVLAEMTRKQNSPMRLSELRSILPTGIGELRESEPLSSYTTLKVGGPADLMILPHTISELSRLMRCIGENQLDYFVLGNGSNLIVRDGGITGLVIHLKYLDQVTCQGTACLTVGAGFSYPKLAIFAMKAGLGGLEFAAGIPGSVGGAIFMNAGIPRAETAARLVSIELVDENGMIHTIQKKDLFFSYRRSELPSGIVASATFKLSECPSGTIEKKMKTGLARRKKTQPLHLPNCGSVFKNPANTFAGALIEIAGLKGLKIGGAEISERHSNFIVNRGQATANDCIALIQHTQTEVKRQIGLQLETEVKIVGRD